MKFRHPHGIRLSLLSGHCTEVGPEWKELPAMFHQAALEKGCHCDQDVIGDRTPHQPTTGPNASKSLDEPAAIRDAIVKLLERKGTKPEFEQDFTAAGNPNANAIAKLCGFKASKDAINAVWHEMQEEADAAAKADADGKGAGSGDGSTDAGNGS